MTYYNVYLDNETISSFDWLPKNPKLVNYRYTYDDFGNVLSKTYSSGTKGGQWEYYVNTSTRIFNKMKKYHLLNVRNNVQRQNITWLLNTGQKNISSNVGVDLNSSQQVFVIVNYNYSNVGGYVTTAYVNSSTLNDTLATGVVV